MIRLRKDVKRDRKRLTRRGLASHIHGVSEKIENAVTGCRDVISLNVLDDCSVWVQKRRKDFRDVDGKPSKKARNSFRPALNCVQHLFTRHVVAQAGSVDDGDHLHLARVSVPCQILPKANWSTIHHRWSQWSTSSGSGCGRKLKASTSIGPGDGAGGRPALPFGLGAFAAPPNNKGLAVDAALGATRHHCLVMILDNISANGCVVRKEQDLVIEQRANGRKNKSLWHMPCQHHTACLPAKPMVNRISKSMASIYVRIGHMMEHGKCFDSWLQQLDKLVDDFFDYRKVLVLPDVAAEWAAKRRKVYDMTFVAMDMSHDDVDFCCAYFNSDPDSDYIGHLCLPECPFGCDGDERKSKVVCKRGMHMTHGNGFWLALLYRFKHYERLSAQIIRSRMLNRVFDRIVPLMFPARARAQAVAQAAALAGAGQEVAPAVKNQVRANSIIKFLTEEDPNMFKSLQAIIAPSSIQHFMNACFESEKLTTATMEEMAKTVGSVGSVTDARCKSFKANFKILTGWRARAIREEFTIAITDFHSTVWQGLPLTTDQKYETSLIMIIGMSDCARRLERPAENPGSRILNATSAGPGGVMCYSREIVNAAVAPLLLLRRNCTECIEKYFTDELLNEMAPGVPEDRVRDAVCFLQHFISLMRTSSASVERAHIPAEESKPGRVLGRALDPENLAGMTYQRFTAVDHDRVRERISDEVFQRTGMTMNRLSAIFRSDANTIRGLSAERSLSGYDMYIKEQLGDHHRVGSPEALEAISIVRTAWRNLDHDEQAVYISRAVDETSRRSEAANTSVAAVLNLALPERQQAVVMRKLGNRVLRDLSEHPIWQAGLSVGDYNSPIRPSNVLTWPEPRIDAFLRQRLAYDETIIPNPPGPYQPHKCCTERVCCTSVCVQRWTEISYRIY